MFQIRFFKTLTFVFLSLSIFCSYAQEVSEEKLSTHLRWKIGSFRNQVIVNKKENEVVLETLDINFFNKMALSIGNIETSKEYFKEIKFSKDGYPKVPAKIKIQLASKGVELFTYHKDKNQILDFWINEDFVKSQRASIGKGSDQPQKKRVIYKTESKKKAKKVEKAKKLADLRLKQKDSRPVGTEKQIDSNYRDFRYGAAFIWDYDPVLPVLKEDINLSRKTPEYFYEVKDRENTNDDKEAHMQLTINLYKKEKWGLMTKSISLYEQKYGQDSNVETNNYLKANALIKKNLQDRNKGIGVAAGNMLKTVLSQTDKYELKRGILRYLIQFERENDSALIVLELAKKLFIISKDQHDKEITIWSSEVILNMLAKLGQVEKIKKFVDDPYVASIIPGQLIISYQIFSNLKMGNLREVIKLYEQNKASFAGDVHPAIIINAAEAYFRKADFEKALTLYDSYIASNSFRKEASFARVRLALCYEVLEKDIKKVRELYLRAIDRASVSKARYEAKIRYVGLTMARQINIDENDKFNLAFLDQSVDERDSISPDMKKLLWLVRLRSFINAKEYKKALEYVQTLPLESMNALDKIVYREDWAEVTLGLVKENFDQKQYIDAIKIWENQRKNLEGHVMPSAEIHYYVAKSLLEMGLMKGFQTKLAELEAETRKIVSHFPEWVERKNSNIKSLIVELKVNQIFKNKEWSKGIELLVKVEDFPGRRYLISKAYYELGNHKKSIQLVEDTIIHDAEKKKLTTSELNDLVTFYIESLDKVASRQKFLKITGAILDDAKNSGSRLTPTIKERISYLRIEAINRVDTLIKSNLIKEAGSFLTDYKGSTYKWRIKYLLAMAYLNQNDVKNGKKELAEIISGENVPEYLKVDAKSELSSIQLQERI